MESLTADLPQAAVNRRQEPARSPGGFKIAGRHTSCAPPHPTPGDEFLEIVPDAGDMASGGSADYRARRRKHERQRRQRSDRTAGRDVPPRPREVAPVVADGSARRGAATSCVWCGGVIRPRSRGPIPKWCSATCRHRAWEQTRAAASGRSAVQIVEPWVEVPTAGPLTAGTDPGSSANQPPSSTTAASTTATSERCLRSFGPYWRRSGACLWLVVPGRVKARRRRMGSRPPALSRPSLTLTATGR